MNQTDKNIETIFTVLGHLVSTVTMLNEAVNAIGKNHQYGPPFLRAAVKQANEATAELLQVVTDKAIEFTKVTNEI